MKRRLAAALLLGCFVSPVSSQAEGPVATIVVDAGADLGTIRFEHGFSGPPVARASQVAQHPLARGRAEDVSEGYRRSRITLIRTHDAGVGDIDSNRGNLPPVNPNFAMHNFSIPVIFPDMSADPEDPGSYNFVEADRLVKDIQATGAQVVYRLGRSGAGTADIPRDLAKYAAVVRHIVLHFNKGWANGFTDSVRYFEVWNEPDLGQLWWRGTPQEYYDLYGAIAGAVRAADPTVKVGGPAIALVNEEQPFREGFLAYVREKRLPLDFFSWHYYSDAHDPYDFVRIGKDIRRILDRYGFEATESQLNEWMDGVFGPPQDQTQQAAFVAAALTYMQDAPIDGEVLYRADREFASDGSANTQLGSALQAYGRFADTRVRLAARGGDDKGLAVLAGRSADARRINVLVTNYEVPMAKRVPRPEGDIITVPDLFKMALPPRRTLTYAGYRGFALKIDRLSRQRYDLEHYRLDANQGWALVGRRQVRGGSVDVTQRGTAPSVDLFVLSSK